MLLLLTQIPVYKRAVLLSIVPRVQVSRILVLPEQVCAHGEPLMQCHIQVIGVRAVHSVAPSRTVGLDRLSHLSSHHQVTLREETCLLITQKPVLCQLAHIVML